MFVRKKKKKKKETGVEEGGGGCTFKFCDICSLQLECVYFYTASHKPRARLALLVNVTALDGAANEILTDARGQRRVGEMFILTAFILKHTQPISQILLRSNGK